jgi:hypothetical protein
VLGQGATVQGRLGRRTSAAGGVLGECPAPHSLDGVRRCGLAACDRFQARAPGRKMTQSNQMPTLAIGAVGARFDLRQSWLLFYSSSFRASCSGTGCGGLSFAALLSRAPRSKHTAALARHVHSNPAGSDLPLSVPGSSQLLVTGTSHLSTLPWIISKTSYNSVMFHASATVFHMRLNSCALQELLRGSLLHRNASLECRD